MSHFYSGIQGQAGEATRRGSKSSGISAYVQSWGARMSVDMHSDMNDVDYAEFRLHGGPSNYSAGTLALVFNDVESVVDALGSGDPKIRKIVERIHKEITKLNEEAPAAVKRGQRQAKIKANRQMREQKAKDERLAALRATITEQERHNYMHEVLGFSEDERTAMFLDKDIDDRIMQPYGHVEPYRDVRGHLIMSEGDGWRQTQHDLTAGEQLATFEAA